MVSSQGVCGGVLSNVALLRGAAWTESLRTSSPIEAMLQLIEQIVICLIKLHARILFFPKTAYTLDTFSACAHRLYTCPSTVQRSHAFQKVASLTLVMFVYAYVLINMLCCHTSEFTCEWVSTRLVSTHSARLPRRYCLCLLTVCCSILG